MVSELTDVQKVLEPSHIFFITLRILVLFGKLEGLLVYYLMIGMIGKLKLEPELKPTVAENL